MLLFFHVYFKMIEAAGTVGMWETSSLTASKWRCKAWDKDVDVVGEPIEQHSSEAFGAEDPGPLGEGQVRGQHG